MESDSSKDLLYLLLIAASFGLVAGSLYVTKTLAIAYGIGVGSAVESVTYNVPLSSLVAQQAISLSTLHGALLESYVMFAISIILFGASLVMYIRRKSNSLQESIKTYGLLHGSLSFVYLLLLFIIVTGFFTTLIGLEDLYMALPYSSLAVCIVCDIMIQYYMRYGPQPQKMKYSIGMDPSKPFSNVVSLQEELFSKLGGHIRIVDKHFNTGSLEIFHRLISGYLSNTTKITILTSSSMLDSAFTDSIKDLKNELSGAGVGLDVRIMDDKDEVEQHERILMDDKVAYRIPPFNIINKRSEHLTRIGYGDAQRRFQQLYSRSITPDNYFMKKAHEGQQK